MEKTSLKSDSNDTLLFIYKAQKNKNRIKEFIYCYVNELICFTFVQVKYFAQIK